MSAKATKCQNCRWWNGDVENAHENWGDATGKCERIHASAASRDKQPARLYPVGTNAWLETKFDFYCPLFEAVRP